jgi:hypothetical protein
MSQRRDQKRRERKATRRARAKASKAAAVAPPVAPRGAVIDYDDVSVEVWTAVGWADLPAPLDTPDHFVAWLASLGIEASPVSFSAGEMDGDECVAPSWAVDFVPRAVADDAAFDAETDALEERGMFFEVS